MSRGYGPKGQLLDSFQRLREAPDPCVIRRGCECPNTCRGKALRQAPDHPIRSSRSAPGKVVHIGNTPRRGRRRDVHGSDLLRRRNRRDPRRERADDARCARNRRARRDSRLDSRGAALRGPLLPPRHDRRPELAPHPHGRRRRPAVHPRFPRRPRDRPRRPRRSLRPLLASARAARSQAATPAGHRARTREPRDLDTARRGGRRRRARPLPFRGRHVRRGLPS